MTLIFYSIKHISIIINRLIYQIKATRAKKTHKTILLNAFDHQQISGGGKALIPPVERNKHLKNNN